MERVLRVCLADQQGQARFSLAPAFVVGGVTRELHLLGAGNRMNIETKGD
jgi:hypothetical protein